MKKTALWSVGLLLAALCLPALRAESLQTRMIPESATWLIHFDVEKFVKAGLLDLLGKSPRLLDREIQEIEKAADIDFFRDISAVTVIGLPGERREPVVAFSGKLDKERLVDLLKKETKYKELPHGKHLIYSWEEEYGVFVNDRLLLISESQAAIESVLDTSAGQGKDISSAPLGSKLKTLSPDNIIIAAVDQIGSQTRKEWDFPAVILQKSETVLFTASEFNKRLNLRLSLQADSQENAKNLGDIVTGLKAFLAMNKKADRAWNLLRDMKTLVQGDTVSLETDISTQEFFDIVQGTKVKESLF